ncbi:hypothetical protein MARCHEWKA_00420 [Brevundimonas phage vB_BpoS-Marchewka]|uniref:Uncharacterized protein n=1 Tax=Brevundimonas phage vB_BpoS-Marchewka TaxID=2948604 RepID=A0A9E7N460_9CAUD|nr:hypothetical protein MARCHEWKA_00420 [Brevundimonas phage vB_BpoS-Marchewka]
MALLVDVTGDVAVDVETHRAFPLFAKTPPEDEGYTCGLLFAGEYGADGSVSVVVAEARDADQIYLGDRTDWTGGLVVLEPTDNLAEALQRLNLALANFSPIGTNIPLGDRVDPDTGEGLWGSGAVDLDETTDVATAISKVNVRLQDAADKIDNLDGFHVVLGDIVEFGDGSWTPGAVPLVNETPVSEAVDRLNEVLGKLIPSQPPMFPNGAIAVSNTAGTQARLVQGYTNNTTATLTPGTAVTRITAAAVQTTALNDVGPGDVGQLEVYLNGALVASRLLDGVSDNGTYGGLTISDQKDFPVETPGFWKSFDVRLTGVPVPQGLNAAQIDHTEAGPTNIVTFMRDDLTASPTISAGAVTQASAGTLVYSSGVPHYGDGAALTVSMSIANLAGETYYGGGDPIQFTGPVIATKTYSYVPATGIDAPLPRNTLTAQAVTPQTITVDGSGHLSGKISGVARNVNGATTVDLGGPTILIKRGSAGARLDEMNVPVTGLGALPNGLNAVRVSTAAGDTPAAPHGSWDASTALPAHEAAVVAGVLAHNRTNYAQGHLPVGPDLSVGRDGAQYATFAFRRAARSAFKINVSGAYAGCWIKLPGVSDQQPNAPGGWWDGFKPYDGAGVPGETGDPLAGCASGSVMTGASGVFTITFGTQSSTNATDNLILVRFKLVQGQAIPALSFTN